MITPFFPGSYPVEAFPGYPPGTTITGVHGGAITGYIAGRTLTLTSGDIGLGTLLSGGGVAANTWVVDGSGSSWTVSVTQTLGSAGAPVSMSAATTLTVSNPANPYLVPGGAAFILPQVAGDAPPIPNNGISPLHSTATFTQTGNNNFKSNDTMNVAGTVYTFTTGAPGLSHSVAIGIDFDTSAANLVAAVSNGKGQFSLYAPSSSGRDFNLPNPFASAVHLPGSGTIVFSSRYMGPTANDYPSIYTPAGTAAGTFGNPTFTGADTLATCPSPCMYATAGPLAFQQLPAPLAYHIVTLTGSSRFSWSPVSNPIKLWNGDKIWTNAFPFGTTVGQIIPASLFIETGSNNFNNGDTFLLGNNTWTFRTLPSVAADVALGPDFQTSSKNITAAMGNTTLNFSGYIAGTTLTVPTPPTTPISVGGILTTAGGVATGTQIISGSGTTFTVSISQTVGSSGSLVAMQDRNYVAPTVSSNVVADQEVGPTWIVFRANGFNAASTYPTVYTPNGTPAGAFTTGNDMTQYMSAPTGQPGAGVAPALGTYAPGSEALLWNIPTGLKRRDSGSSNHMNLGRWGIGESMVCSSGYGENCDLSHDEANFHQLDFVGRWAEGNNYASSSAKDEQFSDNFIADDLELGTLGESLYNPNYESTESGTSRYGGLMFCGSQNSSTIFGGYIGGNNMCSDPVKVIPGLPFAGPAALGVNAGGVNGPNITGSTLCCGHGFTVQGALDGTGYASLGGPGGNTTPILSYDNVGGNSQTITEFAYNAVNKDWQWFQGLGVPSTAMKFVNSGSLDYSASGGLGALFPPGVLLGGDGNSLGLIGPRLFGMSNGKPASLWHLQGDMQINTASTVVPGSQGAWYSVGGSTSLTGVLNGTQLVVEQEIDATPLPTLAANGSGYSLGTPTTPDVTGTLTGNFIACTTQPVLAVTADGPTGVIQSINSVTQKGVCTPPATFSGNISGTTLTVTAGPVGTILVGSFLTSTLAIAPNTQIVSGSGTSWQVSISQTVANSNMTASTLFTGTNAPAWTPGGSMQPGTGAFPNVVWEQALSTFFSVTDGPPGINQTLAGTGVIANTRITAGAGNYWTVNQTYGSPIGPETITGQSWYPAMAISNDPTNPDFTAVTLRSGSSANKDLTGRITLSGGAGTLVLSGSYVSSPDCFTADVTTPANANSVSESAPVSNVVTLTFTGTGTDVLKYACFGRN
jgi:hypothetical protein